MKRPLAFLRAGTGTVVSQFVSLLLLPLLFRAYPPAAFGTWTTVLAVAVAIGSTAGLRYELAIVTETEAEAESLFWISLGIGAVVATLAGTLIWPAALLAGAPAAADPCAVPLIALWVAALVVNLPMQTWLLRRGRFGANSVSLVVIAVGGTAAQLALAPVWPGYLGLIGGSAFGAAGGAGCSLFLVARDPPRLSATSLMAARALLWRSRRFPLYSLPFTLLSVARERAPVLILSAFASAAQVGTFSQAWRLVNIPAGLSSSALRPVIFHSAARDGVARIQPLVATLMAVIAVMGAPWIGVVAAQPRWTFGAVLGPAWQASGSYGAILAVPALLFAMSNWLDRVFDAAGRSDLNLRYEIIAVVLSVGGFAATLGAGVPLIWVVTVQAVGLCISYILIMAACFRVGGYSIIALVQTLVVGSAFGLFTAIVTVAVGTTKSPLTAMIAGIVTALVIDAGAALVFIRRNRPSVSAGATLL